MLNVIIAYDNLDASLGTYFAACKDDIVGYLNEQIANGSPIRIMEIIDSVNCHSAYIDVRLNQYQEQALLFIAYSHGLPHSLRRNSVSYIHSDNIHLLFNACFHTNACSSSKELGRMFHDKNGVSIGFSEEVRAFKEEGSRMTTSVNCDNCGLKYGLSNQNSTFKEMYAAMKSYYNLKIDEWDEFEDFIAMAYLRETRDALTIHGKTEITMHQFINQFQV